MALVEGDGWYFEVTQWWEGDVGSEIQHNFEPSFEQLDEDAHTLTGHIVWYDEDGMMTQEKYIQLESDDGWTEEEIVADAEDAVSLYE